MSFIYAMSDIHAELEVFEEMLGLVDLEDPENRLILLGDYLGPGHRDFAVLKAIMDLQKRFPGQVIAIKGNHEVDFLENDDTDVMDPKTLRWLQALPFFWETDTQIFVHAGVVEDYPDMWKAATDDYTCAYKHPHTLGSFVKDVIAGHVGTATISGDPNYHDVFWDGESHYYIDGTTEESGILPLLKYDTTTGAYTSFINPETREERPVRPQTDWRVL
ncbi:MAG: metallophosphoesterase [Actinomycetaceae bacterium]|nr:metallophosphoesterase [Actinomycetaceae bacterium]